MENMEYGANIKFWAKGIFLGWRFMRKDYVIQWIFNLINMISTVYPQLGYFQAKHNCVSRFF